MGAESPATKQECLTVTFDGPVATLTLQHWSMNAIDDALLDVLAATFATMVATNLLHFEQSGHSRWGVVSGARIAPLAGDYPTTASLIELGKDDWRSARQRDPTIDIHAFHPSPSPAGSIARARTTVGT